MRPVHQCETCFLRKPFLRLGEGVPAPPPTLGRLRFGESSLSSAFNRLKQLDADFVFRNVAGLVADSLDFTMLAITGPPDTADDQGEKHKSDGEGPENFILPELECPPQFGEFIAEPLDLEFKLGVAGGIVVKVAILSSFVPVSELQSTAFGLVARGVGVCRIVRKVKALCRCLSSGSASGENEPRLFLLLACVKELELSIGNPTIIRICCGGLRPVALANDLDEALARIDLVAENLTQVTRLRAEDFLNDRCVAQSCKDGGDTVAYLEELSRNAGDKDGRLVHRTAIARRLTFTAYPENS